MLRRSFLGGLAFALRKERLDGASAIIEKLIASGEVEAASLLVRQGSSDYARGFGKAQADTVFLLASITKPMTVSALMVMRDKGMLSLDDPVNKYIPEFTGGDRDKVLIRHLLTHTSGLPDMLPENFDLRKKHAPLSDFVAGACKVPLLFAPGTKVSYQSMGILLASEIAQRIRKQPFRTILEREIFRPLGMSQTSLGLGGRKIADLAQCQVPEKSDWDWNSPYWRDLGAPWGGAHSNTRDVARFVEYFVKPLPPIMQPKTAASMISIQTAGLNEAWGYGWMRKPGTFGRACSARTYGHYGSTGTVAWHDPQNQLTCVLLTTKPASSSREHLLGPVSDVVSESI